MSNSLFRIILIIFIILILFLISLLLLQSFGLNLNEKTQANITFFKDILLGVTALYAAIVATVNLRRDLNQSRFIAETEVSEDKGVVSTDNGSNTSLVDMLTFKIINKCMRNITINKFKIFTYPENSELELTSIIQNPITKNITIKPNYNNLKIYVKKNDLINLLDSITDKKIKKIYGVFYDEASNNYKSRKYKIRWE